MYFPMKSVAGCGSAILLTAVLFPTCASGDLPFTYETPSELSSTGDVDGDGRVDVVILDRRTGGVRVLLEQESGNFSAVPAQWTRLASAVALTVARIDPEGGADQVVVASAETNRVVNLSLSPPADGTAQLNGLISPAALAAVGEPGGPARLLVATEQNDVPAARQLSTASYNAGVIDVAASGMAQPEALRRGNPVALTRSSPPVAAFVSLASSDASAFRVFAGGTDAEAPPPVVTGDLPPDAQWTWGFFAPLADGPSFLFYERLTSGFVARAADGEELRNAGRFDLGKPIRLLVTVPYGNKYWLLALFEPGSAGLYEFNGAGDPVLRQQWTAPPGESFTTAAALADSGFLLLSGRDGRSESWHRMEYDGSRHRPAKSGQLAPLNSRERQITVFLFDREPFVEEGALIYEVRRERDWASGAESAGPGSLQLTTLGDRGPASGLGDPATGGFSHPPALHPVINQFLRPAGKPSDLPISIASFSVLDGAVPPLVTFDPPPGHYPAVISTVTAFPDPDDPEAPEPVGAGSGLPVTLGTAGGAAGILYRYSEDEPWTAYSAPLVLTQSTTIFARTAGSPVVSGRWTLGDPRRPEEPLALPPVQDRDGNGLPDDWEAAFNQHDPEADPDRDGRTNREEYLAGTDPLDPGDTPPQPAVQPAALALTFQVVDEGGTPCLELSWDRRNAGAELQYSTDMVRWQTISEGIGMTGDGCYALIPLDAPVATGYFRLHRP